MSRGDDLTYSSHLGLHRLLSASQPVSDRHDEMLFIIQHQTSELWLRLIIEELGVARAALAERDLRSALKGLNRATVVLQHLVQSWDVLRTLTPRDFAGFRGKLGPASGLQSHQYRMLEFMLGNRSSDRLEEHAAGSSERAALQSELERPSVYRAALDCVADRLGVDLGAALDVPARDRATNAEVAQVWATVYADHEAYAELVDLGESLVDLEDTFRCWRFHHLTTVERVIGTKPGTGGTSGVPYLRRMLDVELFPEIWQARSGL